MNSKNFLFPGLIILFSLILTACSDSPEAIVGDNGDNGDQEVFSDAVTKYTCPMHPHYISTDPEGSCPICGMDLVPVENGATDDVSNVSDQPVGEQVVITVSGGMIQTMGVRTELVKFTELGRSLRAFGTVEADERLENVSVSRLEGWIEDLNVNAEGDTVGHGDLLYRIFSPDLIAAQSDYLNARVSGNKQRISAVRRRLLSSGMQTKALELLEQRNTALEKVPVFAESDGIVAQLNVREGDYVKPGTPVLRLQSYRQVWVIASIPETDLPLINSGVNAELRFPSAPSQKLQGSIDYIYPTVEPNTRTGKVRIEVDNENGRLLPGAYADISFDIERRKRLSIVSEAILRDSQGDHVIVALGDGRFVSRDVITGISAEGRTEILGGLSAGEVVVASGQFMLDSEVNLREGMSKLSTSAPDESQRSMTHEEEPEQTLEEIKPDSDTLAQIDHLIDMALYIHDALLNGDSIEPRFIEPAIRVATSLTRRFNKTELAPILDDGLRALRGAQSALRGEALAVELGGLLQAIRPWLQDGAPTHYADLGVVLYREIESDRYWLQRGGDPENPYSDRAAQIVEWVRPSEMSIDPHGDHH